MVYQGSKNRISKYLKPIIESYLKEGMDYVEPFVGGANMIDKIEWDKKYGYDNNEFLISLHQEAQQKQLPLLNNGRAEYNMYRYMYNYNEYNGTDRWLIGYYGFLCSFNGRFFSDGYGGVDKYNRNLLQQRLNNLNKQSLNPQYKNIVFSWKDFKELKIKNSVIYLDPPYQGYEGSFNHQELWDKCKEWVECGNVILLSELQAPNEYWECIWQQEHQYSLRDKNNKNKKVIERLFIWKKVNDINVI